MAEFHQLPKLCRVCGGRLQKAKSRAPTHECINNKERLLATFGLDVSTDSATLHPQHFCNSCYAVTTRHEAARLRGVPYQHSVEPFQWREHTQEGCTVCQHLEAVARGGGKNKKSTKRRGRPHRHHSPATVIAHIQSIAPQPFVATSDEVAYITDLSATLECPLCCSVLSQPVELDCGRLVCAPCCCRWLEVSGETACPCCYDHHLHEDTLRQPSMVLVDVLAGLKLRCRSCNNTITARHYQAHRSSKCQRHLDIPSPSRVTVRDILQRPTTAPTHPVERQVAENLVRRLMAESDSNVVRIPTRGQPISLMPVSSPRVPTSEACTRTIKRRVHKLEDVRGTLGIGLEEEIRVLPREQRQELLKEVALPLEIPTEHALAMKTSLSISWNKLRTLRRWLKVFHVSLASERRQRTLIKEAVGENMAAEMVPFTFSAGGGEEIREAPFVYVPNLIARVADMLTHHLESSEGLSWHEGTIPSDEVWVKLGGDKGHGSFKFNMQIVNTAHPNSIRNTCLLAVFKAGDSTTNLHTALDQYQEHVNEMQGMKWRDWKIQLFFTGDYEFLCTMYGLSGAAGRHCCLWCTIRSADLRVPLSDRGRSPLRSLQSLSDDHQRFMNAGGDLKRAKDFNNAIGKAFFSIPLDKVCIPGLHMSLGIFNRLFNLLEEECRRLDLEMAAKESGEDVGGASFQRHICALKQLSKLREEHGVEQHKAKLFTQLATYLSLTLSEPQHSSALQRLRQEASLSQTRVSDLASEISKTEKIAREKFVDRDGPFFSSLDQALANLHVERQAYHGGTFVGNHVHKLLQEKSAKVLCSGIVEVAQEQCPSLLPLAKEVYTHFTTVIGLFAECHNVYNSGVVDEKTVDILERDIASFMAFYRETFPHATVLPKMHILEDHTVPWLRRWHLGAGLMGEQGAESIHAHMGRLEAQYHGIVNPLERLKYVVLEQNLESAPMLNSLKPQPRRYRKRPREE